MSFKFQRMEAGADSSQNPTYPTHHSASTSSYSFFTEQAIRAGLSMENFGRPEMYRGPSDPREAILREIEKERIRYEIIAEEYARKRVLEAEVRRELMIEREMLARRREFSPPFMQPSPPGNHNLFERSMTPWQPIGLEERIVLSLEKKYGGGGRQHEIGGFERAPFQRLGASPKMKEIVTPVQQNRKEKIIVLGKSNNGTLSGAKRKSTPPPPVASGPTEHCSDIARKKPKEEFSCAICQVSATSERALKDHIRGKKHQAKEAAMKAERTGPSLGFGPINLSSNQTTVNPASSEEKLKTKKVSAKPQPPTQMKKEDEKTEKLKRDRSKFWCEICQVRTFCEKALKQHNKGKKHLSSLLKLTQAKVKAAVTEKACGSDENPEAVTKKAVVTEVFAEDPMEAEVKIVKEVDVTVEEKV